MSSTTRFEITETSLLGSDHHGLRSNGALTGSLKFVGNGHYILHDDLKLLPNSYIELNNGDVTAINRRIEAGRIKFSDFSSTGIGDTFGFRGSLLTLTGSYPGSGPSRRVFLPGGSPEFRTNIRLLGQGSTIISTPPQAEIVLPNQNIGATVFLPIQ